MSELQGDGTTTVAVGERDGQVILSFPKPIQWAAFDPETAAQIGEAIAKEAYQCRYGRKHESKSVIGEQVRMRLITRATHVIRSLQDKGKLPGVIASEVVDTILSEVF